MLAALLRPIEPRIDWSESDFTKYQCSRRKLSLLTTLHSGGSLSTRAGELAFDMSSLARTRQGCCCLRVNPYSTGLLPPTFLHTPPTSTLFMPRSKLESGSPFAGVLTII